MIQDYSTLPDAWGALTDEQRAALEKLARSSMGFETLATRNRDRLDFRDVGVASLRDALARAFLAGQTKP